MIPTENNSDVHKVVNRKTPPSMCTRLSAVRLSERNPGMAQAAAQVSCNITTPDGRCQGHHMKRVFAQGSEHGLIAHKNGGIWGLREVFLHNCINVLKPIKLCTCNE